MRTQRETGLFHTAGVISIVAFLPIACETGEPFGSAATDDNEATTLATGADGTLHLNMRIPLNMAAKVDTSWVESLPSDPNADPVVRAGVPGVRVHELRAAKLDERVSLGDNAVSLMTADGFYRGRLVAETDYSLQDASGALVQTGGNIEPRGLSNGVDSRSRLTGTNLPGAIGLVGSSAGSGSGTMVGWRIMRTAAHVVIRHTTTGGAPTAANNVRFDYRRDGATIGTRVWSTGYHFGGNYIAQGCATARDLNGDGDIADAGEYAWGYFQNRVACEVEDWALVILPANWWGAAGMEWMGYRTLGSGETGVGLKNGGYPACGGVDAPNPCTASSFYEDSSSVCKIGSFVDGTRVWTNGCDQSSGMSGGTTREKSPGYFLGHPISGCDGCSDAYPNHSMGFNQWLFDFQVSLNNQNP